MLNPSGQGFTFSNIYDPNLGVLTGLSSTTNTTQANLASLSFTINGLLGAFNDQTSTGSALATETFSYDGDLRPSEETTTWQSGSGSSGTFFDEARGYDAASNVDTVTTTLSQPNGQSGTNSEVQNFCYDEQNELVWAGNSGTQPPAGNGTCGSETLSNTFTGANYNTAFVYTHLGQLWQGPLNGTGANEQYLYCNSSAPHQLSDLVPAGQNYSCANLPKPIPYALPTYDSFGNATSRTTSTGTATLSYNSLDQMVEWQLPNTNQAWDGYDAGGTRTIQHTTIGSTSATTVYAFGLEEYSYDGSGTLLSSTHYYSLAGHLLGELQVSGSSSTTNFFLTDGLGSILGVFSNTANTAALLSTQLFTPYGAQLVSNGNSIGQYTAKGFTGQYNDAVSGLDYYVSRYYDPVAGVFLSADKANGNAKGMNPYDYVGNNPETENDPTGQYFAPPGNGNGGTPSCTDNNTCNSGNSSGYNGWNGYQGWNSGGHGFSCPDPSGCNGSGSNTSTLKSLTPKQIANWCVQNVQCMYAIQRYDDAQFGAFWQNASLFLMGAFEFFEGDPDAIEQAAEEEVTSWEVLAQQFGIKLDDAVSEALASNDPAKQAEGEAGAIVQIYSKLIGFNEKFGPNAMYGEVDAESPEAIVEVKSGGLAGQIKGLIKKYNNSITNPDRKPFVVYGPGWSEKQAMTVYENLGSLDTGQAVYVATNSTQLIEIVEYLAQEGPPSF